MHFLRQAIVALLAVASTLASAQEADFVSVDGVRLEYIDWGGESRPIVLIPASCDTAHVYGDIGPLLARRYRTLAFTPRGCGRSDRPESGYGIDDLADEIAAFLTALGLEKVVLAGASNAGGKITRFAERYPERVEKLIYFDTIYRYISPSIEEEFGKAIADRVGGWPHESFDLMRASERLWELGSWSDAREKNLREVYAAGDDGSLEGTSSRAWYDAYRLDNAERRYVSTGIDHPALMIFAKDLDRYRIMQFDRETRDRLAPIADEMIEGRNLQIEDFRSNGPHVRIIELENTGHYVFVHRTDEVVRLIEEFVETPVQVPPPANAR